MEGLTYWYRVNFFVLFLCKYLTSPGHTLDADDKTLLDFSEKGIATSVISAFKPLGYVWILITQGVDFVPRVRRCN